MTCGFAQFVGGETVNETIPLLSQLRDEGKGVLLAYSVEVNNSKPPKNADDMAHRRNLLEISRSIQSAGDFEDERISKGSSKGKTWVAVKLVRSFSMQFVTAAGLFLTRFSDWITTFSRKPSPLLIVPLSNKA